MKIIIISIVLASFLFAQPSWIDTPTTTKYIGGVGIVKDKTQRRVAKIEARASLLESIKVNLSSSSSLKKSKDEDGNYNKSFSQEINQKAKGALENSYVKDTYTDDDGYYYVWVVVEK